MKICIYDPLPMGNEYCTKMFLEPLRRYCADNGIPCSDLVALTDVKDAHVVLLTDHLTEERIFQLLERNNRIVGINVTDSSYISGAIRYARSLPLVNLIFTLSGVQAHNQDWDFKLTRDFEIERFEKPFLDDVNWETYERMVRRGQIQSLPYVPWTPIPVPAWEPWGRRSQKAILRGGGHARRFLLALHLMNVDRLDIANSGFVLFPYFAEDMNPQFRYCDGCRRTYKEEGVANFHPEILQNCNSPAHGSFDNNDEFALSDLGQWNNRCPNSFFWFTDRFAQRHGGRFSMDDVKHMLNATWLHPAEHMKRMARILFTSDLKWIHSIYQPQRYWEAAAAGCINVLPTRAMSQHYFPETKPGEHYLVFEENFEHLEMAFSLDEGPYREMSEANRNLFNQWIQPTTYRLNTNLLAHMVKQMQLL